MFKALGEFTFDDDTILLTTTSFSTKRNALIL